MKRRILVVIAGCLVRHYACSSCVRSLKVRVQAAARLRLQDDKVEEPVDAPPDPTKPAKLDSWKARRPAKLTIAILVPAALSSCGRERTPTGPPARARF